jgi:hypothetical protein
MESGKAYVNAHTAVDGTGGIRGNLGLLRVVPEPSSLFAALAACSLMMFARFRRQVL